MTFIARRNIHCLVAGLVVSWLSGCGGSDETPGGLTDGGVGNAGASGDSGSSAGGTAGSSAGGSTSGGSTSGGSSAGGSSAGGSSAGGSSAGGSSSGGTGTGGSAGAGGCGTTQCTNCIDDDGDGKIDAADLQCTGAADNDENSYGTGIPGDNVDPKWQDCFFDGNSGAGDDGCRYHTDCLTGAKPTTDPDCTVSQACIDFCVGNTPNGCDCFGCCSVLLPEGGTKDVRLDPACTPDTINDAAKCVPCTKTTQCNNDCGRCELCIGKPTLPPDCTPTGTGGTGGVGGTTGTGGTGGGCAIPTCRVGQQACGVECTAPCPAGTYCLTGCCVVPPPR